MTAATALNGDRDFSHNGITHSAPSRKRPARGVEWAIGTHATERAGAGRGAPATNNGAGNGIRTRDFDLGKVALYH